MYLQDIPSIQDIISAETRIRAHVHRTPVFSSTKLNEIAGCRMFFKTENLQRGGSFKIRGAMNSVTIASKSWIKDGITTHSSGNHAQAIAIAAKTMKIPAFIVMPHNSPKVKVDAVRSYGAKVIFCEATQEAREATLEQVQKDTKAYFIPPYDSYDVIAGQATMMKELIEDTDHLEVMMAPIGGGGLASGTLLATEYFAKNIVVYGAEPKEADDAYRSLLSGEIEAVTHMNTIADGLRTSLGKLTFPIIKEKIQEIILVSEQDIIDSMKLIYQYLKLVVEPSAAVPLAAVLNKKDQLKDKKVGLVLCGGNIDLEKLPFH